MKLKILLLCMLACPLLSVGQAWNYPVKPGTEEWNNLKTEKERVKVMQVPSEVLNKMTSEDIAKTIINFPLFGYYTAFNSPIEGLGTMFLIFNIFDEIRKNKDLGRYLISYYKDAGIDGWIENKLRFDDEYWTIKLNYIEYIIAQDNILMNLTDKEKNDLKEFSLSKYIQKKTSESFNSVYGLSSSLFLLMKIIKTDESIKQSLLKINFSKFERTGLISNNEEVNIILQSVSLYK